MPSTCDTDDVLYIIQVFYFKTGTHKIRIKTKSAFRQYIKKLCLIYFVEGKITKINSHLHWSEPVGANPGPHLSSSSFRQRPDPLQIKRLTVDQDKQHTSWLTLISCRTERKQHCGSSVGLLKHRANRCWKEQAKLHIFMDSGARCEHCVTGCHCPVSCV